MKIAIDARLYGLENAGLGRYIMNLVQELTRIDRKNKYLILLRKNYYDTLTFPDNWKKIQADFRHYTLKEQLLLPLLLYRHWPDLVHFPHFNVPVLYLRRFVVTIHDLIMHKFEDEGTTTLPRRLHQIRRIGYKISFSFAVMRASKIIVPSNEVKNEVYKYYPTINVDKIVCTYEGVTDKYKANIAPEKIVKKYGLHKPYLVYFGNAYPHKNLPFLIKGLKELNKKGKKVYLLISTPRSVFAERLRKMIENNQMENCVNFPGFIPDEELSGILRDSLGFIYPSLLEGFGLQGLEALSSGTLVLASDIPVFREIYKNKVLYFDPQKTESLVYAIKKAVDMNQDERDVWIKQGKEFVKNYSWSKMAKETLGVYEKSSDSL